MSILVIGDIMVDVNYFSKIERNAPEANIPIHNIQDTTYILGGASNVANNLTQMGVDVELISVTGNDYYGEIIKTLLNSKKIKHNLFLNDNTKIEVFYGATAGEQVRDRARELGIDLSVQKIWVDDPNTHLYQPLAPL
jgi:bifunctional ADP-heptose synthase (sugar kinase/adenylyltransferase)